MFGLGSIKLALFAAVLVTIGFLYWQNQSLRKDNKTLTENNVKLEFAVDAQKATIDAALSAVSEWKDQIDEFQDTISEMVDTQQSATAETRRLNDIFTKHDLNRLSLAKPGLVQRRVNSGTADVLGMFESETAGDQNRTGGD